MEDKGYFLNRAQLEKWGIESWWIHEKKLKIIWKLKKYKFYKKENVFSFRRLKKLVLSVGNVNNT